MAEPACAALSYPLWRKSVWYLGCGGEGHRLSQPETLPDATCWWPRNAAEFARPCREIAGSLVPTLASRSKRSCRNLQQRDGELVRRQRHCESGNCGADLGRHRQLKPCRRCEATAGDLVAGPCPGQAARPLPNRCHPRSLPPLRRCVNRVESKGAGARNRAGRRCWFDRNVSIDGRFVWVRRISESSSFANGLPKVRRAPGWCLSDRGDRETAKTSGEHLRRS